MRQLITIIALLSISILSKAQELKEYSVTEFSKVRMDGNGQCQLIPSSSPKVVVEASNADVLNYISVEVKNGTLMLDATSKSKNVGQLFATLTFKVYYNSISEIELRGAANMYTKENINGDKITATMRGTGHLNIDIACNNFEGNLHGSGKLTVKGNTNKSTVQVEGVGTFDGEELLTKSTDVKLSGVGTTYVNASEELIANLNGVGSIRYAGNPKNTKFDKNGVGSIKPL